MMQTFQEWLDKQPAFSIPVVAWGDTHSQIAEKYAKDCVRKEVNSLLDEALNSGDGSYKP